ncbi:dipeptidase PepE [Aliidiomarina sp.]|uniref:dipeptidase PepE n=1 Tax=Aliidiomarina sp. TaxID=1872439 RepID=UPI003A4DB030
MRNMLLLSSSKAGNSNYLEHAAPWLSQHFGQRKVLFIPYAGVTMSHAAYTARVQQALSRETMGDAKDTVLSTVKVQGINEFSNPKQALLAADSVAVGGGNTFVLLDYLYRFGLLDILRQRILAGMPYAGWSAGSNIAGPSIRTTNDMPIVQPPSFRALAAVNFQLNPHYFDNHPPGFHGETRAQRLAEFMVLNPATSIIGIREGTALKITDRKMQLLGDLDGVLFRDGTSQPLRAGTDCSTYL